MSKPNRKVIRLQQMRAQQAQAAKLKYVDIIFEDEEGADETCSFLTQDYWPLEVVKEAQKSDGDANINVMRQIAQPPEAFDRLVEVAKLTVGELKAIIEEMDGEVGTDEGEGSGSSVSSTSTPGASAPTSSATTPAVA
ncbi:hypothetical protein [Streptomyces sp. SID10815]|uniref:hypothetical protein n=1 Tax=Streptomyces sp. SID10815 TaxID=2706027 RepID=UPI0013C76E77|nr:hypothetical protein [Streptomyces sp. SID10815]